MANRAFLSSLFVAALACTVHCSLTGADKQSIKQPIHAFAPLKFGEVMPQGWILDQMKADMEHGITGHFPRINNNTEKQRFVLNNAKPDNVPHMADDDHQRGWWSAEHEAYYADGLFRTAWLIGDNVRIKEATARLDAILGAKGEDGYIGIYSKEYRFPTFGPDGELWTQSRMFQALLAYYEATSDKEILEAVERAVKLTISHYGTQPYFSRKGSKDGGVSHGIGFFDTLEWLYRLTGDHEYKEAYLWLYKDYSLGDTRDLDMILGNVSEKQTPWIAHTPHTAEALAMPIVAWAYSGYKEGDLMRASQNVPYKLAKYSNPSGAMVGDESILNRVGSFELTSEYCTMTETIGSLNRIAIYQNPFLTADRNELIAFNAAQGARLHPAATAVSYLTRDNRTEISRSTHGGRELYSAVHHAAACCALNSTRLMPYYVEGMWMSDVNSNALIARQYGPCRVNTSVGGKRVIIEEQTNYPFSDTVKFEVKLNSPLRFALRLHVPSYNKDVSFIVPHGMKVDWSSDSTYLSVEGKWKNGDKVLLNLNFKMRKIEDVTGKAAIAYGPLLFSLPIVAQSKLVRSYVDGQFGEYEYTATEEVKDGLILGDLSSFKPVFSPLKTGFSPWVTTPIVLIGNLTSSDGQQLKVTLMPIGSTILRITGFKQ